MNLDFDIKVIQLGAKWYFWVLQYKGKRIAASNNIDPRDVIVKEAEGFATVLEINPVVQVIER